jgi:hypothetical protein
VLNMDKKNFKFQKAMWAPTQIMVIHYWGHQKRETTAVWGNWKADRKAKKEALTGGQTSTSLTIALFLCPLSEWNMWHTSQQQALFESEGENFLPDKWWKCTDGHSIISESLDPTFVKSFHEETHLGQVALETSLATIVMSPCSPM